MARYLLAPEELPLGVMTAAISVLLLLLALWIFAAVMLLGIRNGKAINSEYEEPVSPTVR